MKTHGRIALILFALAAFMPLAIAPGAAPGQLSAAQPRIDGFDVEPVAQAVPGRELVFTLYGSPGGSAAVKIGGATGGVVLAETEPGVYEGSYTIRTRDKITAQSAATANLRVGNRVASAILDERLVGKAVARKPSPTARVAAPKITRFEVDAPQRLAPGEQLLVSMTGDPNGTASARIAGVKGKVVMDEVRAGVYEGTHTILNRDRIAPDAHVTGNLRVKELETNVALGKPLRAASTQAPLARKPVCVNCGVVEAINVVEVKGDGSYIGMIAGGVAGALLGSQVGSGRGTTVAQVAGAAGGAFAGNEIEKRMKTTKHWEAVVRLENGGSQTISYAAQPGFAVGAKVRVENGTLVVL